jgi:hypothetical protein
MRIKAEVHMEAEAYADMLPPLDLTYGIPAAGDELIVAGVSYTCARRRFGYDEAGRLRDVVLYVRAG